MKPAQAVRALLALFAALTTSYAAAGFEGAAELLYLRPSLCDGDFAIEDRRSLEEIKTQLPRGLLPKGTQRAINPHYQWGFRAFVGYIEECSCLDVRAMVTRLHASQTDHLSGKKPFVFWPTFGQPKLLDKPLAGVENPDAFKPRARAHTRACFDAVELQIGRRAMCSCHLWGRAFAAVQFIYIDHTFEALYKGFTPRKFFRSPKGRNARITARDHSKSWALGPRFGVEALYDLSAGFGIGGQAIFGVLAGRARGKYAEKAQLQFLGEEAELIEMTDDHGASCAVIPHVGMRLGASYTYCCNQLGAILEIGYEFLSYVNALRRMVFNDLGATGHVRCLSYNLDGLYLSLTLVL